MSQPMQMETLPSVTDELEKTMGALKLVANGKKNKLMVKSG